MSYVCSSFAKLLVSMREFSSRLLGACVLILTFTSFYCMNFTSLDSTLIVIPVCGSCVIGFDSIFSAFETCPVFSLFAANHCIRVLGSMLSFVTWGWGPTRSVSSCVQVQFHVNQDVN